MGYNPFECIKVSCPRCKAPPDIKCLTPKGVQCAFHHERRIVWSDVKRRQDTQRQLDDEHEAATFLEATKDAFKVVLWAVGSKKSEKRMLDRLNELDELGYYVLKSVDRRRVLDDGSEKVTVRFLMKRKVYKEPRSVID